MALIPKTVTDVDGALWIHGSAGWAQWNGTGYVPMGREPVLPAGQVLPAVTKSHTMAWVLGGLAATLAFVIVIIVVAVH